VLPGKPLNDVGFVGQSAGVDVFANDAMPTFSKTSKSSVNVGAGAGHTRREYRYVTLVLEILVATTFVSES
jgi:hypothetical protein